MTTFAIYSIKGGVGKTAACVNLSYLAAASGYNVLVCDLDPQSSTTFYFRVKPKVKSGVKSLIKGKKHAYKSIKGTDFQGLDLLPADFSFRNLDLAYDQADKPTRKLKDVLKPFKKDYDIIFLDCPPNLTLLSENILHAADWVVNPIVPTTLSQRTHEQLLQFLESEGMTGEKILPFFSMVERRKSLHKEVILDMVQNHDNMLTNTIPYLSDIERMGIHREPVIHTKPHSISARAYRALWEELKAIAGM